MNILIVSQYFWPELFRINDIAEGLSARGHQVTVLTGKPNYPQGNFYQGYGFLKKSKEYYGGVEIIRSPLFPRGNNSKIKLIINYVSFALFASIVGIMKCKKPDVIFVYEPSPITVGVPAIVLKKIKKAPILFWVQDLWPESVVAVHAVRSKTILYILNKIVRYIYSQCDYILTTSRAYFSSIKRFDITERKLRYFPQTAEAFYCPVETTPEDQEEKLLPKGFRIIFSGNIGVAQDIESILQAALKLKDFPDIKWIFLGEGSKRCWLQEEIKKCHLDKTVYWLGHFPAEVMPKFFACSDVLLVTLKPEPVFSLTIPAKLQSYLACAKPIIAALNGEGNAIIEEAKAGLTTPSGDHDSLAQAVLDMYALSIEDRNQLGLNGLNYFNKFFNRNVLLQNLETWMVELKNS